MLFRSYTTLDLGNSTNNFRDGWFSGNVTAGYFIGDGSQLTGLPAGYGDSDVATFLAAYGSNTISTTGNITAGNFIGSGTNVDIVAGSYDWTFNNAGILVVPGEGVIRSLDDVVTLQSFNTGSGFANSVYVGTSGGLGFADASVGSNWLEIFRSGPDPQIATPGNLTIVTDSTSTAQTWTFDSAGNLTLPGNTFAVNYANGTQVTLGGSYGNANVVANLAALGSNPVSTTGNVTANYFIGNGSQLTGLPASYGNANVAANLAAFGTNPISTTGKIGRAHV